MSIQNLLGIEDEIYSSDVLDYMWEQESQITKELISDLAFLKGLDNKEFLLYKKFKELKLYLNESGGIDLMLDKILSFDDISDAMNKSDNKLEILLCNGNKSLSHEWMMIRKFIHSLYYQQGPGRSLRYLIRLNGKNAGIITLASDIISIGCRDRFIGWNKDNKHKNLGYIGIGSTIAASQPFGYLTAAGKLMSLMFFSGQIRNDWEEKYGDKLVGCTTTSLYGINSQYNGMPKYWKTLGETTGEFIIFPNIEIYEKVKNGINQSLNMIVN